MSEDTEPSLTIIGRPGRPRAEHESASLSTWIPTPTYDALVKAANDRHMTLSSLVKQILVIQARGFK